MEYHRIKKDPRSQCCKVKFEKLYNYDRPRVKARYKMKALSGGVT